MQIVLFLLFILAILIAFMSKKNSVSKSVKIYMIVALVLIFLIGWLFTVYNQKNAQRDTEIINAFEQGKTLVCQSYKVNSNDFIFVSGTLSFVAKQSKKDLKGVIIDISTCSK
ncbi:MAG: hypothetical protein L3J44_04785 [Campylobacteraceae bacterium]|nr:hypothetical protein [Campylobacteraceae bacterium]